MIYLDIKAEKGKNLNSHIVDIIASIRKAPGNISEFMRGVILEALDVALENAKYNVTGGIIGGNPRFDGSEGKLARALEKDAKITGDSIEGKVYIPEGKTENYIGWRQEVGYQHTIVPRNKKNLFFTYFGEPVWTKKTYGFSASGWLEQSFRESEPSMRSIIQREWNSPKVPDWILGAKPGETSMQSFIRGRYGK